MPDSGTSPVDRATQVGASPRQKTYTVKEIFYTLQGEGANAGRAAVFCRFTGCNLWTGREEDRAHATCTFCDTDFVGVGPDGGRFRGAAAVADAVAAKWPVAPDVDGVPASTTTERHGPDAGRPSPEARRRTHGAERPLVVCTGGEPLLQLDADLVAAFHARGFEVAVETNGTQVPPDGIDWICVSPKARAPLALTRGDELKLVYPQEDAMPERFSALEFRHFFLQPMDGPDAAGNTQRALAYCLANPQWRLSIQTHKLLGIR